jgi:hypothetical protein
MIKQWCGIALVMCLVGILGFFAQDNPLLTLSPELAQRVGLQIWKNECGGKLEGLTTWNQGEEFASLGIGHFIWYPENKQGIFKETFPDLLAFFKANGVQLPAWLDQVKGCPWQTREEFQQAQQDETQQELRQLLAQHVDLQILFMVRRLNQALPTLLKHAPQSQHAHLTFQFYRLACTPEGLYALLDYLNFKGEGIASQEGYQGQGWGLLQVLEQLQGSDPGDSAVEEFVESAKKVLALRVEKAPSERQESRWLKGWYNRLETYCHFSPKAHNGS